VIETVKPAWILGPAPEPLAPDVSKRINALCVVLICLIVLANGARGITVRIFGETAPGAALMLDIVNGHVYFVAVSLLFAIAGFWFLRDLELSLPAYGALLRRRGLPLLVPYILFNAALAVWFFCTGSVATPNSWSALAGEGLFANIFGIGVPPINAPLWILRDLLVFLGIAPLFLLFFKEAPGVSLIALFCLWARASEGPFSYSGAMFAFYLGGYLARRRVPLGGVSWWQRAGTWAFVLVTGILVWHAPLGLADASVRQFLFKTNIVFGLAAFWRLSAIHVLQDSAVLGRLGRHIFFVFLAHEPALAALQIWLLAVWRPTGSAQQIAFYGLSGLTAFLGLWLAAALLLRLAPSAYGVMTGTGPQSAWSAFMPPSRVGR